MTLEYSEEDFYKSLPDELYKYEKLIIAETYDNEYHYATTTTLEDENVYGVSTCAFEKASCKSFYFLAC